MINNLLKLTLFLGIFGGNINTNNGICMLEHIQSQNSADCYRKTFYRNIIDNYCLTNITSNILKH